MPRELITHPDHDREFSLGWLATDWIERLTVYGPGDVEGQPVHHGDEYTGFIVDAYGLRKNDGRRLYNHTFLSRPKGCDKSGLAARFALFEALGPCRYAGVARGGEIYRDPWGLGYTYKYRRGEPMGKHPNYPYIRCTATEETQAGNTYDNIIYNLRAKGPLTRLKGIGAFDAGLSRIILPNTGKIIPSTASSAAKDGGKETFVVFDESHLYNTRELRQMYSTLTNNMVKRQGISQPWFLETTTMFNPGEESVAEATYILGQLILEGKVRRPKLLFDHRWGAIEDKDLSNADLLASALIDAYGDAMEWMDVESLIDAFWDPTKDINNNRRYFLNAETSGKNNWMDLNEWDAAKDEERSLQDGDVVCLGFDGAKTSDSTALVVCRVNDGFIDFLDMGDGKFSIWEKPFVEGQRDQDDGNTWEVPGLEVDAAVSQAFRKYKVVGFFADPPYWEDYVDNWNAEFAGKLKVKATLLHPIRWYTKRESNMVGALMRFKEAVRTGALAHNGNKTLRRHVLNAQRRDSRSGITVAKEYPKSPRKIDALLAATLAYEARQEAISKGLNKTRRSAIPERAR